MKIRMKRLVGISFGLGGPSLDGMEDSVWWVVLFYLVLVVLDISSSCLFWYLWVSLRLI